MTVKWKSTSECKQRVGNGSDERLLMAHCAILATMRRKEVEGQAGRPPGVMWDGLALFGLAVTGITAWRRQGQESRVKGFVCNMVVMRKTWQL